MATTLIRNADIVNEGKIFKGSVLIKDELIKEIYNSGEEPSALAPVTIIDASNKMLIPGVIDDHVHFRQPGFTYKADIFTESKAAVAGGVTSIMEMPNTNPQTISQMLLDEKFNLGERFSLANYSFYIGATNDNLKEILKTDPRKVCGIKLFMGSSTGNMLVNDQPVLEGIFKESPVLIAAHCEDENIIRENIEDYRQKYNNEIPVSCHPLIRSAEACYKSVAKALDMASKFNTRLHVMHVSASEEMGLFSNSKPAKEKSITARSLHSAFVVQR